MCVQHTTPRGTGVRNVEDVIELIEPSTTDDLKSLRRAAIPWVKQVLF